MNVEVGRFIFWLVMFVFAIIVIMPIISTSLLAQHGVAAAVFSK